MSDSPLRQQIFESDDIGEKVVHMACWDCNVVVRAISAGEREAWEASLVYNDSGRPDMVGLRCRFLVKCLYDEDYNRIFEDDDWQLLQAKSSHAIDELWAIADRINTVTNPWVQRAEEKSDGDPSDASCLS